MKNKDNFQQEVEVKIKKIPKPLPLLIKWMFWIFVGWWYFLLCILIILGSSSNSGNGDHLFWEWTVRFRLFGKKCRKIKREYLESQNKSI